ncbi:MAG: ABC transporter ATP-binding protein [Candidatus Woesearchaeota archaeon]
MKNEVILRLENVSKIYKMGEIQVPALKDINLEIKKGDFIAVVGASGSGKSTMMNLMGCLDIPSKGNIFLKSYNINKLKESDLSSIRGKVIGFIFQQYNLIQSMNAFENVILPLDFLEYPRKESIKKTKEVLNFIGLGNKLDNKPTQLSGGEQQRVSIARCLVTNPEIILADEPTGALDSKTGNDLLKLLTKLWKEENKTIIMVTHDIKLAKFANRIIELKDGKIIKESGGIKNEIKTNKQ